MAHVIGQARIDAAADHVRRKQRDIAGPPRQDVLRAALKRGDQGMYAHLSHDGAFLQRILVQCRAGTRGLQRARAQFLNDGGRVQLGPDDGHGTVRHPELLEHFLGHLDHPIQVAVASRHAAAAQDDRPIDPFARFDHMAEVRLDCLAFEVLLSRSQIVGAGIH
ncbi:hypothetical protein D3C87_1718380 [compost metagenome]